MYQINLASFEIPGCFLSGVPISLEIANFQDVLPALVNPKLLEPVFEPINDGVVGAPLENNPDVIHLGLLGLGEMNRSQNKSSEKRDDDLVTHGFSPQSLQCVQWRKLAGG